MIGDDRIRVTEEHPFWVTGEGWVSAATLEPGDCVRTLAGTCQAVVSVQIASADTWVYNLTVATAHTYFVGDGQWLVHNMRHILSRHHPDFWDGSVKATQTFFDSALSADDIADLVKQTIQNGHSTRVRERLTFTYEATINGVTYRARTVYSKVVQFYRTP
jgi:hypothetical protein